MSAAQQPPELLARTALAVRWGDLDAYNHVNNATFLSYLEDARVRWLEQLPGISLRDRIAPVLANSTVNYRRPILWPNRLLVELFVERLGNSSLTMGHRLLAEDDADLLYADGSVVMVWIDTQTGTSVPLPEAVRAACSGG